MIHRRCAWMAPLLLVVGTVAGAAPKDKCRPDTVKVGPSCIDKYEASVWQVPAGERKLVRKILKGTVTLADLTHAGAVQLGCTLPPFQLTEFPASFPNSGNWRATDGSRPTPGTYAVSVPGVLPTTCVSWFQAEQACALADKRLPTNQEWQRAAAGTPDPGLVDDGTDTCVTNGAAPAPTGSRRSCVSNWGIADMVGNVWEWTADWDEIPAMPCASFLAGDWGCLGGTGISSDDPAAVIRGGYWPDGNFAGVFATWAARVDIAFDSVGFRCAR
ncbi:MAG TPA: SUMF1/EgtB/PvdO family nonheme iron enzyme [Candidatus Limnocylindria bacterium]|nr:SUMF1/EgtB/PvdO family nonheme iron enzyme [Candidatus Limnocylindria bacterium]